MDGVLKDETFKRKPYWNNDESYDLWFDGREF